MQIQIRKIVESDYLWIKQEWIQHFGSEKIISKGISYYPHKVPGYIAEMNNKRIGHISYFIHELDCEIVSLVVNMANSGIGSTLIEKVVSVAKKTGSKRVWLLTTNDNSNAIRFYQKKGFNIAALFPNSISELRKIQPEIPLLGFDDIPIRDEIEFEMIL